VIAALFRPVYFFIVLFYHRALQALDLAFA